MTDGSAEQTLHSKTGPALGAFFHIGFLVVETTYCEQIDDLLIKFFFTVYETPYHFLGVAAHSGQFQVEVDGRLTRSTLYVHKTVHADIVGREAPANIKV